MRYLNEAEWIRKQKGLVYYIDRPNFEPANETERQSLREIWDKKLFDLKLNNDGSLEDLKNKIIKHIMPIDCVC